MNLIAIRKKTKRTFWFHDSSISLYSISVLFLVCHGWSAAPVFACLRRGPRGCFHSECYIGRDLMVHCAWTVSLLPPINAEHEAGQALNTLFQVFSMTRTGIEPSLPGVPLYRFHGRWTKSLKNFHLRSVGITASSEHSSALGPRPVGHKLNLKNICDIQILLTTIVFKIIPCHGVRNFENMALNVKTR